MSKHKSHSWGHLKGLPWSVCTRCGLLKLRTELTDWCVKKGCDYSEDPDYKNAILKYTKLR